jgi:hypothetical protein
MMRGIVGRKKNRREKIRNIHISGKLKMEEIQNKTE